MNNCKWLMIGSKNTCNKSTKNEYCGVHNARVRQGSTGPKPCIVCHVGVKGKSQLCVQHGGRKYRALKRYYDKCNSDAVVHRCPAVQTPDDYLNRQFPVYNLEKEKSI